MLKFVVGNELAFFLLEEDVIQQMDNINNCMTDVYMQDVTKQVVC